MVLDAFIAIAGGLIALGAERALWAYTRAVYLSKFVPPAPVDPGKPTGMCSVCGIVTNEFTYPLKGGIHCANCAKQAK